MRFSTALALISLSVCQVEAYSYAFQITSGHGNRGRTPLQIFKRSYVGNVCAQRAFMPSTYNKCRSSTTQLRISESDKEKSIEELYRIAMEEDEEWYNTFVRDVLGEDNLPIVSKEDKPEKDVNEPKKVKDEIDLKSEEKAKVEKPTVPETVDQVNKNIATTPDDDAVVQYMDMYDSVQRVPMSILAQLGYEMADVAKLQAAVLELIIEDEMIKPKEGLPRRWMVADRDSKEVKILKKRTNDGEARKGGEKAGATGRGADGARSRERSSTRPSSRKEGRGDRDGRRKSSDRERANDRKSPRTKRDGDDGESSSIWMDIPTFKQYLRREAELRLMLLGPDWEGWVKGETDWRLNLYKKWIDVVEDGIGDDLFEDMSYAPPIERQRAAPRTRRTKDGESSRERRTRSDSERSDGRRRPDRDSPSTARRENGGRERSERQRSRTPEDERNSNDGMDIGEVRRRRPRRAEDDTEEVRPRPRTTGVRDQDVDDDEEVGQIRRRPRRALRDEDIDEDNMEASSRRPRRASMRSRDDDDDDDDNDSAKDYRRPRRENS